MPIKKNEDLLRIAESIVNFGSFEFELKTERLFFSGSINTIFGWDEEAAIPSVEEIKNQIHPDFLLNTIDGIRSIIHSSAEFSGEIIIFSKKNQQEKYINCFASPKKDAHGKVMGIIGIIQDLTETRVKEKELLVTKNRLGKILESSPDIICTLDEDGFFTTVSSACFNILGYTPEEMIGKHYNHFVYKADFLKSQQAFMAFLNGANITNFENRYRTKKGILIPIIWSANWDEAEKTMYCVARNGIEIKAQEELQIKNEKRYRALVNNSTDAIMILNQKGKPTYVSPSIFKVIGYTEEEALSLNLIALIHPEDVNKLLHRYLIAEQKPGELISADTIRFNKNNEWIVIELSFTNLINDPFIEGMVINFRDVTSRENALNELKLMESAVTHTSDAIIITEAEPFDMPGPKIIFVNEAFCKMTGYSKEEVIGKTPRLLQGPKSDKVALKNLSTAIKKWQKHETTLINYRKNGEEFWINFNISPIANEKGWYTHWIAIERDVTDIKTLELEKVLLAEISKLFLHNNNLHVLLEQTLKLLLGSQDFCMGEIWLKSESRKSINLTATAYSNENMKRFFEETKGMELADEKQDIPNSIFKNHKIEHWKNLDTLSIFPRKDIAKKYQLDSIYKIPLTNGEIVIGIICLGLTKGKKNKAVSGNLFSQLSTQLSAEIIRKQLEIQLNNIFNTSLDLIIIAGLDGYIRKANPAVKEILEYEPAEIINLSFTHFIHPDDEAITRLEAEKLAKGQAVNYFENRLITKNGNIRWLAWTFTPSKEDNLIYGLGKDITEKKNLEDILNKSNKLARIGSWEINLNKGTVFWSDITKEIREVEPDFIPSLEAGISKFKEGFHRNTIQKRVEACIQHGTPWDEELLIETFRGNWKWVRSIGEGEFLNGKCIRVYGSFQDINDKKKAQQEIIESNERFNLVAKATNDLIWDWDIITGETLRLGKSFFENLGYSKNFTNSNKILWLDFIHPDDLERVEDKRNAVFDDPSQSYWEDQYRCKRADGSYAFVYDRGYIVRTSNGLALKMIGSTQDISELKQTEIELAQLNEQLVTQAKDLAMSNKELENFAYIASHDLQEPLRMISSFLTQIEKKYGEILDEKGKKYIFFAVDGAKRMRQIILDLLEFSRVGRQELKEEEVNIRVIIEDILDLYKKQIEEKNAVIEIGPMPIIVTYKATIRQVLQNLISNALKYQEDDKHPIINIKCLKENGYWKFSIQDNGIGIEDEYHDKIFEIFQRLHNKEQFSGTGIGLAIVKKIIEGQGGKIYLESKIGEGSIFYFTIPEKNKYV